MIMLSVVGVSTFGSIIEAPAGMNKNSIIVYESE